MLDSALSQALVKLEALESLLRPFTPGGKWCGITQEEAAIVVHDVRILLKASLDERKSYAAKV